MKFLLILSAVFFTTLVKGQASVNPAIASTLDAFIEQSNNKDWDKAFDLIYPKLFTRVPKQDLIDLMMGMESDGISLRMTNARITSTSVPVTEGEETFVRVEYVSDMNVDITPGGMYDYPKSVQAITEQFQATYGASNVKWVEGSKRFEILASKAVIAVNTGDGGWKLVEINMDQPELMAYLFSPTIMDALVRVE